MREKAALHTHLAGVHDFPVAVVKAVRNSDRRSLGAGGLVRNHWQAVVAAGTGYVEAGFGAVRSHSESGSECTDLGDHVGRSLGNSGPAAARIVVDGPVRSGIHTAPALG